MQKCNLRLKVRRTGRTGIILLIVLGLLWAFQPASFVSAAGSTVTNCADDVQLRSALTAGGAVNFNCGANPVTITLSAVLNITTSASLDGGGKVTLSGGGNYRVFSIGATINFAIQNLAITNGKAVFNNGIFSVGGGAIYNAGSLSISNSTFTLNSVTGTAGVDGPTATAGTIAPGGAIYNANTGNLSLSNTNFSNNSVLGVNGGVGTTGGVDTSAGGNGGAGLGGAIYNNGMLTINGGTFSANIAQGGNGGKAAIAYYSYGGNGGNGEGGAIYNGGTLSVTGGTFTGNTTKGGVGGDAKDNATVAIGGNGGDGNGGAIASAGTNNSSLTNSIFTTNQVSGGNGGSGTTFSGVGQGGSAGSTYGGAVAINTSGTMLVTGSNFSSNLSTGANGGIGYIKAGNSPGAPTQAFGGGLSVQNGTLNLSADNFVSNVITNADGYGGGVSVKSPGILNASNSDFFTNELHGYYTLLQNGGSYYNSSSSVGGAIYGSGVANVSNSTIAGNSVEADNSKGGAVYGDATGVLTFTNVTLYLNESHTISHPGSTALASSIYSVPGGKTIFRNSIVETLSDEALNCSPDSTARPIDGGYNLEFISGANSPTINCGFIDHAKAGDALFSGFNATDNGGPTLTLALGTGSPAINTGNDAVCAAAPVNNLDQRGFARPAGAHCDIGAYEVEYPSVNLAFVPANILVNAQSSLQLTISNNTGVAVTNINFSDTLPAQLSFAGSTNSTCANSSVSIANNTILNVSGFNLAVGASCVVKATVTSGTVGSYQNATGPISSDTTGAGSPSNSATLTVSLTLPPTPTTIIASGGANQVAQVGTAFTNPLKATVKDQNGNPMSGVSVTFSPPASGPSCNFAGGVNTAVTDNNGVATSPTCTANSTAGSYNATASVNGIANPANFALTNSSTPVPPGATTYTYNLPLLANGANTAVGQTTTFVTFQNLSGTAAATVNVQYYAISTGTPGPADSNITIPAKGQKAILPNIGAGSSYGGVVTSNQPLNLVVSESLNSGGSAYNVAASTASTLYSPLALNGQYNFTTSMVVFNAASSGTSTGTIQFFDEAGNPIAAATQNFSVPSHASQTFNQAAANSGLNGSHAYWAKISAANNADSLTAQVIEFGPANFVATFNAIVPSQLQSTLYAPATFNGQFNFVTGMALANPNPTAASVTINYYDAGGTKVFSQANLPIAANGVIGVFQPGVSGLPNTVSSATVVSSQPLVMTVNERGPGTISGTYVGLASGSTAVALPVMAKGFAGFVTGSTVLNAGSSAATLTFSYIDQSGNQVGVPQTKTLGANASFLVYQGDAGQGLPDGFFGTALISSTQPLLVTTNALNTNSGLFYTYTEPSN